MCRVQLRAFRVSVAAALVIVAGWLVVLESSLEASRRHLIGPTPLTNYGVVWEGKLTRSGLPRNALGWQWLRNQGTKSIVTFLYDETDYKRFGFEHVLRMPMRGHEYPTDEQAAEFLNFVQDPNNWPVHMHCAKGEDRTGMMAALARYAVDGWPLDRALDEARQYRGGKDLHSDRISWLRDWASRHKAGSYRKDQ